MLEIYFIEMKFYFMSVQVTQNNAIRLNYLCNRFGEEMTQFLTHGYLLNLSCIAANTPKM